MDWPARILTGFRAAALRARRAGAVLLLPLGCLAAGSVGVEPADAASSSWKYDRGNAQDILDTCAGCHGSSASGGKGGQYPRLAGLDERYLVRQLRAFKSRERINLAMLPYATERELPPDDVRDIARLLSQIELQTKPPAPDAVMSAYQRLLAAEAAFNVPRVDGDIERGAELYADECSDCHGEQGWGEDDVPQLAGQHTSYLRRQIENFQSLQRKNEDMEGVFDDLNSADLENIFAYLASRDD